MRLPFEKVHGLGNDFVLVDLRGGGAPLDPEAAARVCDRRRGVGADGVLTLLPAKGDAELALLIQNADGSVPEMCGNGLRCVIDVARGGAPGGPVRVETGAGLREGWVEASGLVRVTLGAGRVLDLEVPVELAGETLAGVSVDMGNPHLVLFLEDAALAGAPLREIAAAQGPALERHPRFPARVNVGFARLGPAGIELVVFERGAGLTEACGTGAGACALAARATGRWREAGPIPVTLPGGLLTLEVPVSGAGEVVLRGPVARVFTGTLAL